MHTYTYTCFSIPPACFAQICTLNLYRKVKIPACSDFPPHYDTSRILKNDKSQEI